MRKPYIELVPGRVRWYYRIVAANGEILSVSQKYFSKGNARRAADRLASELNLTVKERNHGV